MRLTLALGLMTAFACAQEGTGRFPAILEHDSGLPTHTAYRPQDLSKVEGTLPIIAWGNGACANNGLSHRNFLLEIASHGYLAIAIGPPAVAAAGRRRPEAAAVTLGQTSPAGAAPGPARVGPDIRSVQLLDAIDWALAEDGRNGSPYKGKLDPSKIAVMGMSCGGIQAYAVATDPLAVAHPGEASKMFREGVFQASRLLSSGAARIARLRMRAARNTDRKACSFLR